MVVIFSLLKPSGQRCLHRLDRGVLLLAGGHVAPGARRLQYHLVVRPCHCSSKPLLHLTSCVSLLLELGTGHDKRVLGWLGRTSRRGDCISELLMMMGLLKVADREFLILMLFLHNELLRNKGVLVIVLDYKTIADDVRTDLKYRYGSFRF